MALRYEHQVDADNYRPCSKDTPNPSEPAKNESAPVIAASENTLVDLINTWSKEHPETILDGLTPLMLWQIKMSLAEPVVITYKQETFQLNRFQIDERLMGWVLKRIDGSCLLIKIKIALRDLFVFHIWLGGDRGFTSEITADKKMDLLPITDREDPTTNEATADFSDSDGKPFKKP